MPSARSLLEDTLKQSMKERFEEATRTMTENRTVLSDKAFKVKVVKSILGWAPGLVENFDLKDLDRMMGEDDPCEFLRNQYPCTVFDNLQIIKESTNLNLWLLPGYKRTEVWKQYVLFEYRTTIFQMYGAGLWVVTQEALNRQPGIPRIRIPAVDQYPDSDVLPLKQYLLEHQ